METVRAPEGYEGCCYYVDGTRSYQVSVRSIGATWWTNVGSGIPAHLPREERLERARLQIERAVAVGVRIG